MNKIKLCDDESYQYQILKIISEFESYQYIKEKLLKIINCIDNYIDCIVISDEDIYKKLHIYLKDFYYFGFNYDFKNYPLISVCTNHIVIDDLDAVVRFNDDSFIIDLSLISVENFEKIV